MTARTATLASGTVATSVNPSDTTITLVVGDAASFPALAVPAGAVGDDVSDTRIEAGTANQYFHAVLSHLARFDADGNALAQNLYREVVRVWKVENNTFHVLRGIKLSGGVAEDTLWDATGNNTVYLTHVLAAQDLAINEGKFRGEYQGGENVKLGTDTSKIERVAAKEVNAEKVRMGASEMRAATSGGGGVVFVPNAISGGSEEDNTLVTRGASQTTGCFPGGLCTEPAAQQTGYTLRGGNFGEVVTIIRYAAAGATFDVVLAMPSEVLFSTIATVNTDGTGFIVYGGVNYNLTNLTDEIVSGWRRVSFSVASTLALATFQAHLASITRIYTPGGHLVSPDAFFERAAARSLAVSRHFTPPVLAAAPGEDEDADAGYSTGNVVRNSNALYLCTDASTGAWRRIGGNPERIYDGTLPTGSALQSFQSQNLIAGKKFSDYQMLFFTVYQADLSAAFDQIPTARGPGVSMSMLSTEFSGGEDARPGWAYISGRNADAEGIATAVFRHTSDTTFDLAKDGANEGWPLNGKARIVAL